MSYVGGRSQNSNATRLKPANKRRTILMKTKFIVATALFGITAFAGLGLVYADEEASENEQKIAIAEM